MAEYNIKQKRQQCYNYIYHFVSFIIENNFNN